MEPHSIVVVSLHSPKERLWGELVDISNAGVTLRGIDLELVRRFCQPGAASGGRPHRPADFVFSDAANRADRARRGARLDSFAGRNVREKGGPLAGGLSRAVRLIELCLPFRFRRTNPMKPMHSRILTVPNQLTFLRLAFLPFFIIAIKYERYDWALGILVVCGRQRRARWVARARFESETPLGAYLDPIADKLLLSSSYFVLALKGKIGWWLAILVLGRDVLILVACAVILLTVGYRPFPPSIWGKATTFFEIRLSCWCWCWPFGKPARCGYCGESARTSWRRFVVISGLHYSIVVARQLHAGRRRQVRREVGAARESVRR